MYQSTASNYVRGWINAGRVVTTASSGILNVSGGLIPDWITYAAQSVVGADTEFVIPEPKKDKPCGVFEKLTLTKD